MSRGPAGFAAASLAFALWLASTYARAAVAPGLAAALLLVVAGLGAAGSGRVLAGALGLEDASESQRTLIGATLGLGLLSYGALGLAALGWLRPGFALVLLGLLWLFGYAEVRAVIGSLGANRSLLSNRPLPAGAILLTLAVLFWMTWAPPHQYDSLVYHLALPQAYVRAGGLVRVDHLIFSHFPQNGEMLFAVALLLKSDLLAQMFCWLATALAAWWVFEMGRREVPLTAVLLGCLLLVTHTAVMLLSSITYVEPLVMLWVTAAVLSYLRWTQVSAARPGARSWLLLAGLFLGMALGTKYYAGLAAGLLGAHLLLRLARAGARERRSRAADLAAFVGAALALFSPWLIKNALTTGNPVFPFLYTRFPAGGHADALARGYWHILEEYGHTFASLHGRRAFWKDVAALPFLLVTNSERFGKGMDVLGDMGWDLSFWLFPAALWAGRGNRYLRGLAAFCACYLSAWFATGVVFRFLTVLAPLLCLLAGSGLHALWGASGRWARLCLAGAAGTLTLLHVFLFLYVHAVFGDGAVLLGLQGREEFLSRRLDYYPCARQAGARLGENVRILLVGEQRGYYLDSDHAATTVNTVDPVVRWADEAAAPADLAARLRAEGFGGLLFVPREARRLNVLEPLGEKGRRNWEGLEAHLKPVFEGPACRLYALGGPGR